MYRVYSGPNGQYVAHEDAQGFHRQPQDGGSSNGWEREDILQRRADRLNGMCETDDIDDELSRIRAGVYHD